ncbi:MAG: hypothetical protein ACJAT4_003028 [Granulosicoccus sp.]|jgi:hypothetical protein
MIRDGFLLFGYDSFLVNVVEGFLRFLTIEKTEKRHREN